MRLQSCDSSTPDLGGEISSIYTVEMELRAQFVADSGLHA